MASTKTSYRKGNTKPRNLPFYCGGDQLILIFGKIIAVDSFYLKRFFNGNTNIVVDHQRQQFCLVYQHNAFMGSRQDFSVSVGKSLEVMNTPLETPCKSNDPTKSLIMEADTFVLPVNLLA